MDKKITGIVDVPLKKGDEDRLQIESFEIALSEFIKKTSTPISIALQGEWGSGKTSLMNRLDYKICQSEKASFYSVWLNTWHYALLKSKENILEEIINALINNVISISKEEYPEKLKSLIKDVYKIGKNVFKGVSKVAVKTAVSQINEDAAEALDDVMFNDTADSKFNLQDLKNKLGELINELIKKNIENGNEKSAFIFFIDDLDRVEPALAVNILELLKNIFDIDNCIFVLAIDYEVVVKGLKSKFGELNDKNEREFRSFFDKIIQLPFQMPVSAYDIENYISEMLFSVNFITKEEAGNSEFVKTLVQFTNLSVGSNPRSIKRLVNTLSFINLLIKSKKTPENKDNELDNYRKQIVYALTCLQTGFPAIFNLLADNPNIENWSDEFATKYNINKKDKPVKNQVDFNEKWEHILFEYCNKSQYLKRNFFNISNIIKEMQAIAENNNNKLHEILPEIIEMLSVTSIKPTKKPQIEINNIRVLYALNKKLLPALKDKLKEPLKFVERKGRMIAKISYKFDEQKKNNSISVFVFVKHNNIYLKIGNSLELFTINEKLELPWNQIENRGKIEVFNQITADLKSLQRKYADFTLANTPRKGLIINKQTLILEQYFQLVTENIDYIYSDKIIDSISNFIIEFMQQSYKIVNTDWKAK
ncbi:MAG: P-loop NTPase fold protein [Bacteroidota bacterium]